ncbi:MAG: TetR/AcrR family transcriptional regulator [Myxococcaceae bacterium]|nr:TetR/AcrR family transcriptional regulator [Myxococcaceae bacterium]
MGRPKKSEERDTRQNILDAALDLFSENGFFGTSMRDIAKQVGVRESALYHHFKSKDAIVHGLAQTLGPGHARHLAELDIGAMLDAVPPRQLLEQVVQFMITSWSMPSEQKMFRFMLSEGPRLGQHDVLNLPAYAFEARRNISRVFVEMMRRKLIKKRDPMTVTIAFMAPLMMLRVLYLVMPKGPPDLKGFKAEVDAHLDFFWASVT